MYYAYRRKGRILWNNIHNIIIIPIEIYYFWKGLQKYQKNFGKKKKHTLKNQSQSDGIYFIIRFLPPPSNFVIVLFFFFFVFFKTHRNEDEFIMSIIENTRTALLLSGIQNIITLFIIFIRRTNTCWNFVEQKFKFALIPRISLEIIKNCNFK